MAILPFEPLSDAIYDYHLGYLKAKIIVVSDIEKPAHTPVSYFFREPENFPSIELSALSMCRGRVLDIGAGAGCHALALQELGHDVVAIDIAEKNINVMKSRGVKSVLQGDFFSLHPPRTKKFDTLLLMMNGIGIVSRLEKLPHFFKLADRWLAHDGIIIFDSLDLRETMNSLEIEARNSVPDRDYFGESRYRIKYKRRTGDEFWWLYIDPDMLAETSERCGFCIDVICPGEDGYYLARLSRI